MKYHGIGWKISFLSKNTTYAVGLNQYENRFIEYLYRRQMIERAQSLRRGEHMKRLILLLPLAMSLGCTVHAAPPPPPVPPTATCNVPIQTVVVQNVDVQGVTIMGQMANLSEKVCGCSDGLVRWGAMCQ